MLELNDTTVSVQYILHLAPARKRLTSNGIAFHTFKFRNEDVRCVFLAEINNRLLFFFEFRCFFFIFLSLILCAEQMIFLFSLYDIGQTANGDPMKCEK